MQHPILSAALGGVSLALVVLVSIWALGGYDGTGFAALTLGIVAPIAIGIGFGALIAYGRRSRRDREVDRRVHKNDADRRRRP